LQAKVISSRSHRRCSTTTNLAPRKTSSDDGEVKVKWRKVKKKKTQSKYKSKKRKAWLSADLESPEKFCSPFSSILKVPQGHKPREFFALHQILYIS
jgi:hypothetical protein